MTTTLDDLYLESLYFEACALFTESMHAASPADMRRLKGDHRELMRLWHATVGGATSSPA